MAGEIEIIAPGANPSLTPVAHMIIAQRYKGFGRSLAAYQGSKEAIAEAVEKAYKKADLRGNAHVYADILGTEPLYPIDIEIFERILDTLPNLNKLNNPVMR